jgi:hypothetical protein
MLTNCHISPRISTHVVSHNKRVPAGILLYSLCIVEKCLLNARLPHIFIVDREGVALDSHSSEGSRRVFFAIARIADANQVFAQDNFRRKNTTLTLISTQLSMQRRVCCQFESRDFRVEFPLAPV